MICNAFCSWSWGLDLLESVHHGNCTHKILQQPHSNWADLYMAWRLWHVGRFRGIYDRWSYEVRIMLMTLSRVMHECQTGDSPHRWTLGTDQSINTMNKNTQTFQYMRFLNCCKTWYLHIYIYIHIYSHASKNSSTWSSMNFHENFNPLPFSHGPLQQKEPSTSQKKSDPLR